MGAKRMLGARGFFSAKAWYKKDMGGTITRQELKEKIDRGDDFELVETLSPTAYNHAHLPGARNLPPDEVAKLAPHLLPNKWAEIVVYCANPT